MNSQLVCENEKRYTELIRVAVGTLSYDRLISVKPIEAKMWKYLLIFILLEYEKRR